MVFLPPALEEQLLENGTGTVCAREFVDLAAYGGELVGGTGERAQGIFESLYGSGEGRDRERWE